MRTIISLVKKEFLQVLRDRKLLPIVFLAPIIQLILFGYVVSTDIKNLPLVVQDSDKSALSRRIAQRFENSGVFKIVDYIDNDRQIIESLDSGKASLAVVIPPGFSNDVNASRKPQLEIVMDGTDSNSATQAQADAVGVISSINAELISEKLSKNSAFSANISSVSSPTRVLFNPNLKSVNYMVPGLIGLILTLTTTMLTSLAIVKEKEHGTLEQLIVSPIKRYQLIAGKILPFVIIGFIDVILIVAAGKFWFGTPFRGRFLLLLVLSGVFLFTTIGQGLLASTISQTQQQAMMTSWFFLFPAMLLSGFVFPIENMPKIIQYVTYLIPLRYFLVIVRGIFLKGIGIRILWEQVLAMGILGSSIFVLSVLRFRKKLAE